MASILYPMIDPVAFRVGPLAVHWYGLSYVAGFIVAGYVARWLNRRWSLGLTDDNLLSLVLYCVFGVLIGGRLGYVLVYGGAQYWTEPLSILQTWEGGMSWHGGFVGIVAAGALFCRVHRFSFVELADVAAIGAPAGFFFGRIANFINAELWGRVSDAPWAMVFPGAGPLPRHPSQLYEALLEGLVMGVVLLALSARRRPTGFYLGAFMAMYGGFRLFVELFREPDTQLGYLFSGVTMGQLLSVPLVVVGVWLVARALRRSASGAPGVTGR